MMYKCVSIERIKPVNSFTIGVHMGIGQWTLLSVELDTDMPRTMADKINPLRNPPPPQPFAQDLG